MYYSIAHPGLDLGPGADSGPDGESVPFDREALFEHLRADKGSQLVLWAAPASQLLAACLSDGMDSQAGLQWVQSRASDILDLFRRARRQVLILPADASWLPPEDISRSIRAYFSERTPPAFQIGIDHMPESGPASLLYRLVSDAAIGISPALKRLDLELRASMGQAVPDPALLQRQVDTALEGLSGMSRPAGQATLPAGIDEGPQTALDAQRALVAEIQEALLVCQQELEWYHKLASRKGGGLEQRRIERELLAVREERDVLRTRVSDLKRQLVWAKRDAEQVRHALDETRNSTSWKLTAPFRKLRGGGDPEKDRKLLEGPASDPAAEKDSA